MLTVFKVLARLKGLRGTALDVFGYTHERQSERALIAEYMQQIENILSSLSLETHAHAVKVAQVAENIKGFGHVKERNIRTAKALWASLEQA